MLGLEKWLGIVVGGKCLSGVVGGRSVKTGFEIESGLAVGNTEITVG